MRRSALRIRPARALLAVLLGLTAVFVLPVAASAHDELIGSDPAPGSSAEQSPTAITLTFSGLVSQEPGATVIEVTDAAGAALVDGSPTITDNVVSQPIAPAQAGAVTVLWKVVSSDGHPISGELTFTVTGGASPSPTPDATATASEPAASPSASASETAAAPSPTADPEPASSTAAIVPWIIVGVVAAAAGGAIVYLLLARAQGRTPGTGGGADR
ncbi:copper resistance protein CopC [Microbacterium invictum]|uniref:Copper resistance protein CopC n=1 Tax=Microbacterium invictum TaxID=515415 RepID=A0ABZ0V9F4_9MICO|nr:copper resistance protein CopC [Microbacterium invictum]WQB69215.1 copper resistance protein CopC [Microbacterium invictum]